MYDIARLLNILKSILGEVKEFSNHEYYFYCPFCNHHNPKLAVNLAKGKWQCWTCNAAGNRLISLFKKLDVPPYLQREIRELLSEEKTYIPVEKPTVTELTLPSEFKPLWKKSIEIEFKHAWNYLLSRGVTKYDIIKYEIGYCSTGAYANRIIVPSFDENGKLNFFVGRDFFGHSKLKYKNPPVSKNIIGFDFYINWDFPITLCEGVFDAISLKRNAIPLFGKTLSKKLIQKILNKNIKEINVVLDSDAFKASAHISEFLTRNGISVNNVKLTDKDPGEMEFSELHSLIKNEDSVGFKDILTMKMA